MYLLFPGRHQLLTEFQFQYLQAVTSKGLNQFNDINGEPIATSEPVTAIVFAVTSANHSNTRRNPLSFYLRALAIQDFSQKLGVPSFIYGIDDVGDMRDFANYTLKQVKHESEGMFDLNPSNCIVVCSTPVLDMYEHLGFRILPAELKERSKWTHITLLPWDAVERIAGNDHWEQDLSLTEVIHKSSRELYVKYKLDRKIQLLFKDHMISDDGDITTTRDYNSYVRQMDEVAELKYNDTAPFVRPGRIGDIGCAVGSWIRLACRDERFRESDFYGIEVARHLFDICHQRKHNGEFANPFVFFSQRNAVTGLVFDAHSMNTIHTSSLTHEIESYGSREDLLNFIRNRYSELTTGGVWINRDVVGPEHKNKIVMMKLNTADGRNADYDRTFETREQLSEYLKGLSTAARFMRFVNDFRKHEGYQLKYRVVFDSNSEYIELTLRDACEFMSRKDYVDNWESEMHETFCFWSFTEWSAHLEAEGFVILPQSRVYTNNWIVDNRLKNKVELYERAGEEIVSIDYPVTNMILVAEKK
ncbi:transferase [Chryseolinea sp. T2]|uniref:transferase n=1 Tax=Chryseolinea sp. T2 TaxID=3129255 RepID=UPI003076BC17